MLTILKGADARAGPRDGLCRGAHTSENVEEWSGHPEPYSMRSTILPTTCRVARWS
ncbi:hypothetical protein GCM10017602_19040 [Herbiconiux flava]|nr:hypothetical protein GCM10017602_19040 [Herbiconiux flava]